ncbi:DUF2975 domain-containing protein [Streptomyces sp. SCSIO 30461]|uniref:DUF2975 domain-containing protein n=1 Tax=Streptomyces sp. SCSIO 30461 TaxID=3118085 RepID=UPI0030D3AB23
MGNPTVLALRLVLPALLAGSLLVQTVMAPMPASGREGLDPDVAYLRTPALTITVLGLMPAQVVLVCVWRLVTMVRRGTVFSGGAFRYVDVMIGAITAAALLAFALGVVLAPGEAVPSGVVLLMCGAGLAVLGVALIVLVLQTLLAQAVARDVDAARMRTEPDGVI